MPRRSSARHGLTAGLVVLSLALAACGGGDVAEPDDSSQNTAETGASATTQPASPTTQPASQTTDPSETTTETTEAASSASIEVDPAALPADPSGYDTWSTDLCTLYTPEQLDAFFVGKGELVATEPLDQGCRWSVEGFPRSHYVNIVVVEDGTDSGFQLVEQLDIAGTQVDIGHGPEDIVAMIPTPDGTFLRVRIHGDFDAPPGPLDHYLDDAASGLAENLISRL